MMRRLCLMGCALLFCASFAATARDDGRLTLRVAAVAVDGDIKVHADAEGFGHSLGYDSERIDFGDRMAPRIEAVYRFNQRNRLIANWFEYRPRNDYVLDQPLDLGKGVVIPAGSRASAGARFRLATLLYDHALIEGERVSFGLQGGLAWGAVEGVLRLHVDPFSTRTHEARLGFAPVLGARFVATSPGERWLFLLQGQYVNADWARLKRYNGELLRAGALVEYRPTANFGIHLGYDAFRLDIREDFGRITGGAVLRFRGPMAGIGVTF